tara:strand:- start:8231 stop:8461 length:231 start_codon:yes stop_codon:yes gene_type:complete
MSSLEIIKKLTSISEAVKLIKEIEMLPIRKGVNHLEVVCTYTRFLVENNPTWDFHKTADKLEAALRKKGLLDVPED